MSGSLKQGNLVVHAHWLNGARSRVFALLRWTFIAHHAEAICAVLLLLMGVNLLTAISRKSITNDEIVHIPAGYYHLVAGEFYLNVEHPPLFKMWAALPLLFIQPKEPEPSDTTPQDFMVRTLSFQALFWEANRARFEEVSFWPRVMMIIPALALGALVFVYTRRLFGARAAILALTLLILEPTLLAHGRIVHTDVPATLMYLLFFFTLHRHVSAPSLSRALQVGALTGLALVTKFSMIVIVPVFAGWALYFVLWAPRRVPEDREIEWRRRPLFLQVTLAAVLALLIVNAAYYFRRPPIKPNDAHWVELVSPRHSGKVLAGMGALSRLVPTPFLFGLYSTLMQDYDGRDTSLLGSHGVKGHPFYFPVAFALKTSLPFLFVSIVAIAWSCYQFYLTRSAKWLALLAPLALYTVVCMRSNINIGVRHFLPAYPFIFIMGGALLDRLLRLRPRQVYISLVAVLLGWMAVEAVHAYPDYTSYMNQLAANRPHWWYLSDSNIEWGDDVGELAAYLKAHREQRVSAALIGGWATLGFYGVQYVDLFAPGVATHPSTHYVAVGASFLNGSTVPPGPQGSGRETREERVNFFEAYRHLEPEAVFGNSIYLYRVAD
jgi:hypothetical protein